MTDPGRSGGTPPKGTSSKRPAPAPSRRSTQSRQQRREAQRRRATDPRLSAARTAPAARPAWQSPMVLVTLVAVVIGVVVIVFASGILGRKSTSTGLTAPLQPTPQNLVDPANPRALGRSDAPVTVEVWSDFQCPFCQQFALNTGPAFISQYVAPGKARLVYRDVIVIDQPATNTHGESHQAAAAARCAQDQGKFWAFHDYLFENQKGENAGTFSAAFLGSVADAVGLDRSKYDACMASGASPKLADVDAEAAHGRAAGVSQTPTITVNGVAQALPGQSTPGGAIDLAQLASAVDAALAAASPAPSGTPAPSGSAAPSSSP